jgi:Domain of unknown function (DUF4218)
VRVRNIFFNIMVHLTVYLMREIRLCSPIFLWYMYSFERAMGQLKGLVLSRSWPEWSIVEGYITKELIEFYTDYLEGVEPISLPKSRHEGKLRSVDTIKYKLVTIGLELCQKTYFHIPSTSCGRLHVWNLIQRFYVNIYLKLRNFIHYKQKSKGSLSSDKLKR